MDFIGLLEGVQDLLQVNQLSADRWYAFDPFAYRSKYFSEVVFNGKILIIQLHTFETVAKQGWLAVISAELLRKHESSHLLSICGGDATYNVEQVMLDHVYQALSLDSLSLQEPLRFHLCRPIKHLGFHNDGLWINQGLPRTQAGGYIFDSQPILIFQKGTF